MHLLLTSCSLNSNALFYKIKIYFTDMTKKNVAKRFCRETYKKDKLQEG